MTLDGAGDRLTETGPLPPDVRAELLAIVARLNRAVDDLERIVAEEAQGEEPRRGP